MRVVSLVPKRFSKKYLNVSNSFCIQRLNRQRLKRFSESEILQMLKPEELQRLKNKSFRTQENMFRQDFSRFLVLNIVYPKKKFSTFESYFSEYVIQELSILTLY